ncbi:Gfo/Idh/MocA family protein [Listeria costaricensis]|uniref:Gfo/Idh/MocA family protein n=1 Tax=Listeria costaricensis TaxID=2026604 RepID=UPI000C07241A|nr:Gfo/Idh/MocA family oxidoreductase [Listeria costaricensis]
MLQIAIIGYGGMGTYHVELINASDRVRVKGIFDIDEARGKAAKERGLYVYRSYQEVLADPDIAAVLIATPNDVHKKLAIRALEAGKHVISEKPVTITTTEFQEILETAAKADRTFMVHQNRRWDEDFLTIKRLKQEKLIGDVFHLESRVQGANGIPGDWRHKLAQGGGMVLDWGVHLLDQLLFMEDSRIESVYATLSYVLGDEVDDGFTALIRFESGLTAHIEVGTTNFIKLPRWYVRGTAGNAVIEDWDLSGRMIVPTYLEGIEAPKPIQAGVGLTKTMAPPSEEATAEKALPEPLQNKTSFYNNFANVVLDGQEAIVKNEEVMRVMKLIEAIFTSARENRVVTEIDE